MQITINVTIITFPVMASRTNLQLNQMVRGDNGNDNYTVSHKKTRHIYFCDNSGKY